MGKKKKGPAIRWMKKDSQKVKKAVKNVNQKIKRLNKKGFDLEPVNEKTIMQSVKTRKELNALYKDFDKFRKRGSEKGKSREDYFEFEKNYLTLAHKENERRKAKELEEYKNKEMKSRGEGLGYTREQASVRMNSIKWNSLQPRELTFDKKRGEFNRFVQNVEFHLNVKKMEKYKNLLKENYLKGLYRKGFSSYLYKMVAFIDTESMLETMDDDYEASLEFIYDKHQQQIIEDNALLSWEPVFEEKRAEFTEKLKKEGVNLDAIHTIENLSHEEFLNEFVSDFREVNPYIDVNSQENYHLQYNINTNIKQINRNFTKKK